jgi:fumarylacetoacetase
MPLRRSWVASANSADTDFPLNNLPYCVFSKSNDALRLGVAIGDRILDAQAAAKAGHLPFQQALSATVWNDFMALGRDAWRHLRDRLMQLLAESAPEASALDALLVPMSDVRLHLPIRVSEFTDFYSSKHHAVNVGTMFRGPENALPPNWLSIPIGYNGRASSVVVSGTNLRRPWGQIRAEGEDLPRFHPTEKLDFELEIGAIVGQPSQGMISVAEAHEMIFGYVLLNDWSARDIQAWEYQPLGPFQAKATATSVSPFIVTALALEPFRCPTPPRERPLLPYLQEPGATLYDIGLDVALRPADGSETIIARTNYREMYFSAAQQLAHHASCGCPMRVGDLLGSGTISGAEAAARGSLLELTWNGAESLALADGMRRGYLQDGDSVILRGSAQGEGFRIGFGACEGKVLSAAREAGTWGPETA